MKKLYDCITFSYSDARRLQMSLEYDNIKDNDQGGISIYQKVYIYGRQ